MSTSHKAFVEAYEEVSIAMAHSVNDLRPMIQKKYGLDDEFAAAVIARSMLGNALVLRLKYAGLEYDDFEILKKIVCATITEFINGRREADATRQDGP